MSPKVWFITGSSTGLGRSMTELVLKNGDIAVATLRKPDALSDLVAKYPAERLLVLKLDVAKPDEITAAFSDAVKQFGRIDIVFNNAAYATLGEVEGTPDDVAQHLFNVNFWGATQVSKEAIKVFREVNKPVGGRLLQVSSMVGIMAPAGLGFYSASKHALEGLSDALATEIDPEWNIKITLVEPGAFRTNGVTNMGKFPPPPAYTNPKLPTNVTRDVMQVPYGAEPDKAAEKMYRLAELPEPPLHFPLGKDAISAVRQKLAAISADFDKYESWSDDM
ncbi:predicted protein [Postia placenta Mad-698-R]|uniref:NAD-P-binding protein n=1 Tax=Postia placenta MAD-698-R-SB12 TaxID=670580 RepID=A0A1X6NDL5_9APHY|nr:hypothetical protein POSPLADRAFT_1053352 [Postia placenta MAD-698-R-SB12]EED79184.1 predicted protein [Postia placenta Mad-698-R]EED82121.1 predicted protein [Postia placenta Mad-698-R]OSX66737.1 hypothetical protein POSPLADRAFT_1053352 [Postia placenta MAD-698-R-SB12]